MHPNLASANHPMTISQNGRFSTATRCCTRSPDVDHSFAAEATVYAGGMYCSACSWLIETSLSEIPGVSSVDVNPITHRLRIRWLHENLGLGDLLASTIGFGLSATATRA